MALKAVGRTRGGLNTKIHTLTDALGNPLEFLLTAGNVNDSTVAVELLSRLELSESNILADKAYGTNQILDYIQRADGEYTIPPKSNAEPPKFLCKRNSNQPTPTMACMPGITVLSPSYLPYSRKSASLCAPQA